MAIKKVVWDWETTLGQDPVAPAPIFIKPNGDTGMSATRQTKTDESIGGDIDANSAPYGTFNEISGSLKIPMTYENMGVILRAMFGAPTTTGASAPYTHTFVSTVENLPSFLLQETGDVDGVNQIDRYNGLIAKSIGLSVAPDGDYNVDLSIVGVSHRDSVVDGVAELSETNAITLAETRIKNDQANLLINNTTYVLGKSFSMTYDRGSVAEPLIGSGLSAGYAEAKGVSATGNLESLFDTTLYTNTKNETPFAVDVRFVSGTNQLDIFMDEVQMSFNRESKKVGEKYPVNGDFTAFKNTGTELVRVVLVNNVASY